MYKFGGVVLSAMLLLSAAGARAGGTDRGGIRPRAAAEEYAAWEQLAGAKVAASALSKDQLRHIFVANVADGYVVLEVALYPAQAQSLNVNRDDFVLRIGGSGEAVRPVSAETVAGVLERKKTPKPPSDHDVNVYPSAGIGYESGTTYDGRHVHGVTTAAGVGVGVGPAGRYPGQAPGTSERDRNMMEGELSDKELPSLAAATPVAGYLYFPAPSKKSSGVYELVYEGEGKAVRLFVPPPRSSK